MSATQMANGDVMVDHGTWIELMTADGYESHCLASETVEQPTYEPVIEGE